jgi:ankyrin repeat protein
MENVALKLISMNKINIGYVNNYGNTAFLLACFRNMEKVALELLKTEQTNLEQVNNNGNTAFIWACQNKMEKVIREIMKNHKLTTYKPGHITKSGKTALMIACENKVEWLVLELIKTNMNLDQVDEDGRTALTWTCFNDMSAKLPIRETWH